MAKLKKRGVGADGIDRSTDFVISGIATAVAVLFAAVVFIWPEQVNEALTTAFWVINDNTGFIWEAAMVVAVVICLWLCFGPLKNKRFGNEKPDMSNMKFYAMIFVFASSASIVYWVFIEFFYYLETPPWGAEPFGYEALKWASTYSSYHWGLVPFCGYALMGVCFAYFVFVQRKGTARVSALCAGVIGEKAANGLVGKIIDAVFLVGIIISTAGYSLGVSVPIVGTFVHNVLGIENDLALQTIIIVLVTIACMAAMFTGLKKGMATISTFRAYMFFVLAAFIVVAGGSLFFALNNAWESIGWQFQHFFQMNFYTDATSIYTDPVTMSDSGWPQSWTIFFYIMMIAAMLSSGLYYAKLCKGRTVRQSVAAIVLASALGNAVFFWTIGNHTIFTYLGDPEAFKAAMAIDPYNAISMAIEALPFSGLVMACFAIYAFISIWTFAQSAIFSMAMVSQPNIPTDEEPTRFNRLFWCVITGVLAIAFLSIGGLQMVKNAIVWAGIPTFILCVIVVISQWRDVKVRWLGKEPKKKTAAIEEPVPEEAVPTQANA